MQHVANVADAKARVKRPMQWTSTLSLIFFILAGCSSPPVVAESSRTIIRGDHLERTVGEAIAAQVETIRAELAREFGRDPPQTLTLEFVDHLESAHGAYCCTRFFGFLWLTDVIRLRTAAAHELPDALLRHEMVHFFVERGLGTAAPFWYQEGLAEYLGFRRRWSLRELCDLVRHASELNPVLLGQLVRANREEYYHIDVRPPSIRTLFTLEFEIPEQHEAVKRLLERGDGAAAEELMNGLIREGSAKRTVATRAYEPARHYDLSRLVLAALETNGWPVTREDPTPRIAADPANALEPVRRYARRLVWERVLAQGERVALPAPDRCALAEGLGLADADLPGANDILRKLVVDSLADVRDRAALSLHRRGDPGYLCWIAEVYIERCARYAQDQVPVEDMGFFVDLEEAIATLAPDLREPTALREYLAAHHEELGRQILRVP